MKILVVFFSGSGGFVYPSVDKCITVISIGRANRLLIVNQACLRMIRGTPASKCLDHEMEIVCLIYTYLVDVFRPIIKTLFIIGVVAARKHAKFCI